MNNKTAIVGAVGLGAALMYFFDPDRGKRRRTLVRDKVEAAGNKVSEYAEKTSRDIQNRAYGVIAETKAIFRQEEISDDTLAERVRAKLGRYPVQMGAIDVRAHNGTITLTGPIHDKELPTILRATRFVRGVKEIDNQLSVHTDTENAPELQGTSSPLDASMA